MITISAARSPNPSGERLTWWPAALCFCLYVSAIVVAIFVSVSEVGSAGFELGEDDTEEAGVGAGEAVERSLDQGRADAVRFNRVDDAFDAVGDQWRVGQAHHRRRVDHDMVVALEQPRD